MNLKISIRVVLMGLSLLANTALAGGGPHERPGTCRPGKVIVTPPHTAAESLIRVYLGKDKKGDFLSLDLYAEFKGQQTSKAGPGCTEEIVYLGVPSLHLQYSEFAPNYTVVAQEDYTTDARSGITVEPIWENTSRVIGVRYVNKARQEKLTVICNVEYEIGHGSHHDVWGKADGVIHGVLFDNADVPCASVAWVTNLPR